MSAYTSLKDEQFFGAIGRLTISWGHLEFAIDCMVHIMHRTPEGKKTEPEMPRSLQRKISFLRSTSNQIPTDTEGCQRWLNLLDKIQSASQKRHDIIHGFVVEQEEQSGKAEFIRLIRKGATTGSRRYIATTENILQAANEANQLASNAFRWVNTALGLLREPQQPDDEQKPS